MKTIIFDFDGVIHDTFEFHRTKLEKYFEIELSEKDFKDMSNGSIFDYTNEKIKKVGFDGYSKSIYSEYSNLIINKDIKDVLLKLKKQYNLHIISSGGINNVADYLKNNHIHNLFGDVLCYEFHKSKIFKFEYLFDKYEISPDDCIFVTDTLGDILEANEVDIKTYGVDFGYHDKETLKKGNPDKIISDFSELLELLK